MALIYNRAVAEQSYTSAGWIALANLCSDSINSELSGLPVGQYVR